MEIGRIGREPLGVGLADRVQGLFALEAGRGRLHHLERAAHAALDRRGEELLLRPEEAKDVGLGDPDRPGDCLGRAAVEPVRGELHERGLENLLAALLGALSFGDRHGSYC